MPAPKTMASIKQVVTSTAVEQDIYKEPSTAADEPALVSLKQPPAPPAKPKMIKVRYLRGLWIDNPNKGKPGEADTVKIPRGTVVEMTMEQAFDAVETGMVERWRPGAPGYSIAPPTTPPPTVRPDALTSPGGQQMNAWADDNA